MDIADFEFNPEWKLEIGRFMVAFAECELWTHQCIRELLTTQVAIQVSRLHLESRAGIARAALEDSDLDYPRTTLPGIFSRLRQLSEFRNLVAHNPPQWAFKGGSDGAWEVDTELVSARNPTKSTDLDELRQMTQEAEALHSQMQLISRAFLIRALKARLVNRDPS